MTKNRGCTSDIGQSYTGEPSKLVESDQLQDWSDEFDIHFMSLYELIENDGAIGTKQAIKDFISNLIEKEVDKALADQTALEERVRVQDWEKEFDEKFDNPEKTVQTLTSRNDTGCTYEYAGKDIKHFIAQTIKQEREDEKRQVCIELLNDIIDKGTIEDSDVNIGIDICRQIIKSKI